MQVLKGCKKLAMSVCSMGRIPGGYITNHVYSWVDPQGRSVSPPPDEQGANQRQGHSADERTVRKMCVCRCDAKRSAVHKLLVNKSSHKIRHAISISNHIFVKMVKWQGLFKQPIIFGVIQTKNVI